MVIKKIEVINWFIIFQISGKISYIFQIIAFFEWTHLYIVIYLNLFFIDFSGWRHSSWKTAIAVDYHIPTVFYSTKAGQCKMTFRQDRIFEPRIITHCNQEISSFICYCSCRRNWNRFVTDENSCSFVRIKIECGIICIFRIPFCFGIIRRKPV